MAQYWMSQGAGSLRMLINADDRHVLELQKAGWIIEEYTYGDSPVEIAKPGNVIIQTK